MPIWLILLTGLFKLLGLVGPAEQIILNWQAGEAARKAQAAAEKAAPTSLAGVEDKLDAGQG